MRRKQTLTGVIGLLVVVVFGMPCGVGAAQIRVLDGWRDGILTAYAVVDVNGRQYRTDEMGPEWNRRMWARLPDADRMRLARIYSHMQNHIRDHFGASGQAEINAFYNGETGWSDLVEALQQRHSDKNYPELNAAFGPDVSLGDIKPSIPVPCWSVRHHPDYLEAVRLDREVTSDFNAGRHILNTLTQAKWDQVGVAVKGISGPLIRIIVDNFMTGLITQGASLTSEALAGLYAFQQEIRDFVNDQSDPTRAEQSPGALIEKLDAFMDELELAGMAAIDAFEQKLDQLKQLVESIEALNQDYVDQRSAEATAFREERLDRIEQQPASQSVSEADAIAIWNQINADADDLKQWLNSRGAEIVELIDSVPEVALHPELDRYYDGFTSGFDGRYRILRHTLEEVDEWQFYPVEEADTARELYRRILEEVDEVIDEALSVFNVLEGRAMGLDAHEELFSFVPSEEFHSRHVAPWDGVRHRLERLLDHAATPERTLEHWTDDIDIMDDISMEADAAINPERANRLAWMQAQFQRYGPLRFNFEASLSYQIAAIRQLDALHEDPYYRVLTSLPYLGSSYDIHVVDMDAIWDEINAHTAGRSRELARERALRRLLDLNHQERKLIHRLETARAYHEADRQILSDYFDHLRQGYRTSDFDIIIADFQGALGAQLIRPDDLAAALIDDPTDYLAAWGGWVRLSSDFMVSIHTYHEASLTPSPVEQLRRKSRTYYELLELFDEMESNRSALLALSQQDFDAYYSQAWTRIVTLSDIMELEGIGVPGGPARLLSFQSYIRLGNLRSHYRGEPTDDEMVSVSGHIRTDADFGVEDIPVLLSIDGFTPRTTVTGAGGAFRFDGVAAMTITVEPQPVRGFTFTPETVVIDVGTEAEVVHFTAVPTPASGYGLRGVVLNSAGNGVGGIYVSARSNGDGGTARFQITRTDGRFDFRELPPGNWVIRPEDPMMDFSPHERVVSVNGETVGVDFEVNVSVFAGNALAAQPDAMRIRFPTAPGRLYRIWFRGDLHPPDAPWLELTDDPIPGNGMVVEWQDDDRGQRQDDARGYYRISVETPF